MYKKLKQKRTNQQAHEIDVLVERVLVPLDGQLAQLHLLLLRLHASRQQPVDAQRLALLDGERHALGMEMGSGQILVV